MPNPPPIDYCRRGHFLNRYQVHISLHIRQKMFDALALKPGMEFLEVGTTPDMTFPDQNFFSKKALAMGCKVSVTSVEDCADMARANGFTWIPWDQITRAPSGKSFDCVISAAVLEHVGAMAEKIEHLRFLGSLSRRYVAVTTPNRGHWFEIHTKLPLIHWLPKPAHRVLLRLIGLREWGEPTRMDLVWASEFRQLVSDVFKDYPVQFKTFRLLGAVSNLMAVIDISKKSI